VLQTATPLEWDQYAFDYADNSLFQFVTQGRNKKVAKGVSPLIRGDPWEERPSRTPESHGGAVPGVRKYLI
jgi:hypothetical protein